MIDDFEAIMVKMEEIHRQFPSLRFGQIIEGAANAVKDVFYLTNNRLLLMLERYLEGENFLTGLRTLLQG